MGHSAIFGGVQYQLALPPCSVALLPAARVASKLSFSNTQTESLLGSGAARSVHQRSNNLEEEKWTTLFNTYVGGVLRC